VSQRGIEVDPDKVKAMYFGNATTEDKEGG
jgi:hypothetical protein